MDTQTEEAIGAYCSQSFMMKCASILGNARLEEYEYNSSDDSMVIAIELNGPINTSRVEDVIVSMFKHKPVVLSGAYTQEYIIKGCAAYYNANIKIRAPKSPSLVSVINARVGNQMSSRSSSSSRSYSSRSGRSSVLPVSDHYGSVEHGNNAREFRIRSVPYNNKLIIEPRGFDLVPGADQQNVAIVCAAFEEYMDKYPDNAVEVKEVVCNPPNICNLRFFSRNNSLDPSIVTGLNAFFASKNIKYKSIGLNLNEKSVHCNSHGEYFYAPIVISIEITPRDDGYRSDSDEDEDRGIPRGGGGRHRERYASRVHSERMSRLPGSGVQKKRRGSDNLGVIKDKRGIFRKLVDYVVGVDVEKSRMEALSSYQGKTHRTGPDDDDGY